MPDIMSDIILGILIQGNAGFAQSDACGSPLPGVRSGTAFSGSSAGVEQDRGRLPVPLILTFRPAGSAQRAGDSSGGHVRRDSSIGLISPTSLPSGSATIA